MRRTNDRAPEVLAAETSLAALAGATQAGKGQPAGLKPLDVSRARWFYSPRSCATFRPIIGLRAYLRAETHQRPRQAQHRLEGGPPAGLKPLNAIAALDCSTPPRAGPVQPPALPDQPARGSTVMRPEK